MMYCRQNQSRTLVKRPLGLSAPTPMKLTSSLDVRESFTLTYCLVHRTRAEETFTDVIFLSFSQKHLMQITWRR